MTGSRRGRARLGASLAVALCASLLAVPSAQARDAIVESFDGTEIVTHFFPAPALEAGERAPTIMLGHGWGGSGATSPPAHYADAGYNVLTWDARGFGGSGGTVMIDHPEFEGRDAQALIDFIAEQPEAQLDAAGDPRVGMDGPSYGGAIQLVTAGLDDRVDAITPTIAWNDLQTSLYKSLSVKLGWGSALVGLGIPTSLLPGVFSPAGIQTGNQSPEFFALVTEGTTTGRFSDASVDWLQEHGPDHLLDNIDAPTLIVQGTVDTLFTLDEADRNYRALKQNGVPVKMLWICGGHGACFTETDTGDPFSGLAGDSGHAQERKLVWFERYLKGDTSVDTGPEFEWIDEEGSFRQSDTYPPTGAGSVSGSGAGPLPLTPGVNSGVTIFASPSPGPSVNIPIDTPPPGSDLVGAPRLKLDYTATGVSPTPDGDTHVFAQLVDLQRNLVVGNQATPIRIELDGQPHSVELDLERIASLSTSAGYQLQIIPQTTLYDAQRATGAVQIANAEIELPLVESASGGAGGDGGESSSAGASGSAGAAGACLNLIRGSKRSEKLRGSEGPDRIKGRGGADRIPALGGDDCIGGGSGRDRIDGGEGADVVHAASGGRDRVNCGPGVDVAFVKRGRDSWRACEQVHKR